MSYQIKKQSILFSSIFLVNTALAQNLEKISIIDEGINTRYGHLAYSKFTSQLCYSEQDDAITNPEDAVFSLCPNGSYFDSQFRSATFPGTIFHDGKLKNVVRIVNGQSFPYRHGNEVSNAAWDFSTEVYQQHIQAGEIHVDGASGSKASAKLQIENVVRALKGLAQGPIDPNLAAVNISSQFTRKTLSGAFLEPEQCRDSIGSAEVSILNAAGIVVISGLLNDDIPGDAVSWPACLNNVINVGAVSAGRNTRGLGVGKHDVHYFADDTSPGYRGHYGSSYAAPRIAAAYALLRSAVPQSTLNSRAAALHNATTRRRSYQHSGARPYIKPEDMTAAITWLRDEFNVGAVIDGGELSYEDNFKYGPNYGVDESDFSFVFDAQDLIQPRLPALNQTTEVASINVPAMRDMVLEFTGIINSPGTLRFRIEVNGTTVFSTSSTSHPGQRFGEEYRYSITLDREYFLESGENTVRIIPGGSNWGIKDISAKFIDPITLSLNQKDTNRYGSEDTPKRPSGLRATFNLSHTRDSVVMSAVGWDISSANEVTVFVNGVYQGALRSGSINSETEGDFFVVDRSNLRIGRNMIEFVQNSSNLRDKWGVTDLFVAQETPLVAGFSLDVVDRRKYGHNYGTNRNRYGLNAFFNARSQHDHKISWQLYDIDRHGEVAVFLNDVKITDALWTPAVTGRQETMTVPWWLFREGLNKLSFRSKVNGTDGRWGVTNLSVVTSEVVDLDQKENLKKEFAYRRLETLRIVLNLSEIYSHDTHQTRLHTTFTNTGRNKTIVLSASNIASRTKMAVYLNGSFLRYVNSVRSNPNQLPKTTIRLTTGEMIEGENTLSFRLNQSGYDAETWGITFDRVSGVSPPDISGIIMMLLEEDKRKVIIPPIIPVLRKHKEGSSSKVENTDIQKNDFVKSN